jgi:hypothetical protein
VRLRDPENVSWKAEKEAHTHEGGSVSLIPGEDLKRSFWSSRYLEWHILPAVKSGP